MDSVFPPHRKVTRNICAIWNIQKIQDQLFSVIRTSINDAISPNDSGVMATQSHVIALQIEEIAKLRLRRYFVTVLDFDLLGTEFPDAFAQARLDIFWVNCGTKSTHV